MDYGVEQPFDLSVRIASTDTITGTDSTADSMVEFDDASQTMPQHQQIETVVELNSGHNSAPECEPSCSDALTFGEEADIDGEHPSASSYSNANNHVTRCVLNASTTQLGTLDTNIVKCVNRSQTENLTEDTPDADDISDLDSTNSVWQNVGEGGIHYGSDTTVLDASARVSTPQVYPLDLSQNANVLQTVSQDTVRLHTACSCGNLDLVEKMLHGGLNIETADENQNTPLAVACRNNQIYIARYLINEGAYVNRESCLALFSAIAGGSLHIVQLLLDSGARLDTCCLMRTQSHIAQGFDDVTVGDTPLMVSAAAGHVEITEYLLRRGASVSECNKRNGNTAAHTASMSFNMELIAVLHRYGASVNQRNKIGHTPLHNAVYMGDLSMVQYLLDADADINIPDIAGKNALHYAVFGSYFHITVLLLEYGAIVDASQDNGATALHIACSEGAVELVRLLSIHYDANPNLRDNTYRGEDTALHVSVYGGHLEIVKILVKQGVNLDARDHRGATALIVAARYGYASVVDYLVKAGASLNTRQRDGDTALVKAIRGLIRSCDHYDQQTASEFYSIAHQLVTMGAHLDIPASRVEDDVMYIIKKDNKHSLVRALRTHILESCNIPLPLTCLTGQVIATKVRPDYWKRGHQLAHSVEHFIQMHTRQYFNSCRITTCHSRTKVTSLRTPQHSVHSDPFLLLTL